ncbi:hypothetical protein OUZ56_015878 [Daphnia magna]|uniref:ENTH domain-containing protein n=1 Tax=Daphnia magna TaxID=35525 RepID=A0ABR0AP36_9CRUS|nr:hypothetical protein OUZ56_015878 [Daphnia magna]
MNVSGIRRNIKNIAHNYTDAQVKVREATSNDPWGPPSSLMSEISDLTYNVVAFSEIMQMIWKRLNDHGKNYRHVYKALVLLDYLVKTGNEKVAQQCKENIFAIHTLRDFQYYEDGKDQGIHVREKSKALEALLKDDERLKNERIKALKARERFAQQTTGFGTGSDSNFMGSPSESFGSDPTGLATRARAAVAPTDLDLARPQTAGEEELQLQLALAMSREEAEKEDEKRRSDDVRLALAISQSQEAGVGSRPLQPGAQQQQQQSHLLDLLDVSVNDAAVGWVDPWGTPAHPSEPPVPVMPPRPKQVDAWGSPVAQAAKPTAPAIATSANLGQMVNDPWAPTPSKPAGEDPWSPQPPVRTAASANDPWSPAAGATALDVDDFDLLTNRAQAASPMGRSNGSRSPFDLTGMDSALTAQYSDNSSGGAKPKKSPESFLGPNSNLVNLENLVPTKPVVAPAANPFALGVAGQPNPFQQQPAPRPSINELRHQQNFGVLGGPQQQQLVTSSPPQQLQQLQPMTGVLQPAPAGVWGPTPPMMQSGSGVTSPTFNPFLA